MDRLSPGFLGLCATAILALGCLGACKTIDASQPYRLNLSAINTVYAEMQATELSDLDNDLAEIINERLACYSKNLMAPERVRECRKNYVRQILELCRQRIQSAPRLGEAILGFQYCPISHAVCKGDNIDDEDVDCILAEIKCIEYWLDRYWRGGGFSRDIMFPE